MWLDHPAEPAACWTRPSCRPSPVGVSNIDYDAKGQRTAIDYGNGVSTTYDYDPLTFRLAHLLTGAARGRVSRRLPAAAAAGWPGCQVQNLHYTYDPAGNITHIRDDAQQTIFFRNKRVEPSADYTYDALYRLIEATGREHSGRSAARRSRDSLRRRAPRIGTDLSASDGNAMGTLRRALRLRRRRQLPADAAIAAATRPIRAGRARYAYTEPSLIEAGRPSNRLTSTTDRRHDGRPTAAAAYGYDAHGNMLRMPHLRSWRGTTGTNMRLSELPGP